MLLKNFKNLKKLLKHSWSWTWTCIMIYIFVTSKSTHKCHVHVYQIPPVPFFKGNILHIKPSIGKMLAQITLFQYLFKVFKKIIYNDHNCKRCGGVWGQPFFSIHCHSYPQTLIFPECPFVWLSIIFFKSPLQK